MARVSTADGGYGGGASVIHADSAYADTIIVPDAELLFRGAYHRAGPDLVLTGHDGRHHIIPGYFASEKHPALVAPNGAKLTGDLVDLLAGSPTPAHYAQAQPITVPDPIGKVEKVVGDVTVVRNGVSVALHIGDAVFKSDVIATGADSAAGISFPDGTVLDLVADSRMALNEYSFEPNGTANGALFTLVEGTFGFVAGQVAHDNHMSIATPVAALGIRGTAGIVRHEFRSTSGHLMYSFLVLDEIEIRQHAHHREHHVGAYEVRDNNPDSPTFGELLYFVRDSGYVTYVEPQGPNLAPIVTTEAITDSRLSDDRPILQDLADSYAQFNANPGGTHTPGSGDNPIFIIPPPSLPNNGGQPFNIFVPVPGPGGSPPGGPVTGTGTGGTSPPSNPGSTNFIWNANSGNWDTASGWNLGQVPGSPQDSVDLQSGPVTFNDTFTIGTLIVEQGVIFEIIGGTLMVLGGITDNGAIMVGGDPPVLTISGPLTVASGASLAVSDGEIDLTNVTLTNNGTVEADGLHALINVANVQGVNSNLIEAIDGGQIIVVNNNNGGGNTGGAGSNPGGNQGTMEAVGEGSLFSITNNTGSLDNFGSLLAQSGGQFILSGGVTNHGATSGNQSLALTNDTISGGLIEADSGGTVSFDHSQITNQLGATIAAGGETTNGDQTIPGGTVSFLDSQVNNGGNLTADLGGLIKLAGTTLSGGLFTGAGAAEVVDSSTINGNADVTISQINVDGGKTLTLDHATIDGTTINLGPGAGGSATTLTEISVPGLNSIGPSVSADGQFVAFIASTTLPGQGDVKGAAMELYNVATHQLTDISAGAPALPSGDTLEGFNNVPSISADGRFVVFDEKYLIPNSDGPSIETSDVLLYDSQSQTVTVVQTSASHSEISANGQYIVMQANPPPDNTSQNGESILVTDRSGNILTDIAGDPKFVPQDNSDNFGGAGSVYDPAISGNGRFVTFWTTASEIEVNGTLIQTNNETGNAEVYLYDRQTNALQMVSTNGDVPGNGASGTLSLSNENNDWPSSLSNDGRYVVFQSTASNLTGFGDPNGKSEIYLYDTQTGHITLVSLGVDQAAANGDSIRPEISADGSTVTFASNASNLPGANGTAQTYVYDVQTGTITLLSAAPDGTPANNESDLGSGASADGSAIAFGSLADNLVTPTQNDGKANIFVTNAGSLDVTGDSTIGGDPAVINGGTVTVESGVTLTMDNVTLNGTFVHVGPGASLDLVGTIDNGVNSAIQAVGPGSTVTSTNSISDGSGINNTGTIGALDGASISITVETLTNNPGGVISSTSPGSTFAITEGNDTNNGTVEAIGGGSLTVSENVDGSVNNGLVEAFDGGILTIEHNHGTGSAATGVIGTNAVTGVIEALNGGIVTLDDNRSDVNDGLIQAANGGIVNIVLELDQFADGGSGPAGGNFGTFQALAGGTINVQGGSTIDSGGMADAIGFDATIAFSNTFADTAVENLGQIFAENGGTVSFNNVTISDGPSASGGGEFEANGGTLFVSSNSTLEGATPFNVVINADGVAEFDSLAAPSPGTQHRIDVTFDGAGTFALTVAPISAAIVTLTNFGLGDTLDLKNLAFSSGETATVSGGILTIADEQFTLAGSEPANGQVVLISDPSGGTEAVFGTAAFWTGGTDHWNASNFQDWNDGSGPVPTALNTAEITTSGITVTLDDTETVGNLVLGAPDAGGPTLEIGIGASLLDSNALDILSGQIFVDADASMTVLGPIDNQGTITLRSQGDAAAPATLTLAFGADHVVIGTLQDTGDNSIVNAEGTETLDNGTLSIGSTDGSHLINYDPGGVGATLVLGSNLTIDQTGMAQIASTNATTTIDDEVVSFATINTSAGSTFYIQPDFFTNRGDINADQAGATLDIIPTGSFTNFGTVAVSGGQTAQIENGIFSATQPEDVTNETGGVISVSGVGSSLSIDSSAFVNSGALTADGGTILVEVAVTGNGTSSVSNDGLLEFQSSVSADQAVAFTGSGTVKIDAPGSFNADITMAHADPTEVLDLGGFNSQAGDTFSTATSFNGTVTSLTVTDTTQKTSETVKLVGDFTTATWNVTADGSGGANVSDPPATNTAGPSVGGPGNDAFVFHPGMGAETVDNFNAHSDTIELDNFANIQNVEQLAALITADPHGDAVIALGHNDSIALPGVTPSYLQAHLQSLVHLG